MRMRIRIRIRIRMRIRMRITIRIRIRIRMRIRMRISRDPGMVLDKERTCNSDRTGVYFRLKRGLFLTLSQW
jgi:hypothetical protein